jgi:hypothetical protein
MLLLKYKVELVGTDTYDKHKQRSYAPFTSEGRRLERWSGSDSRRIARTKQ